MIKTWIIGVTGGVGVGKSSFVKALSNLGAAIIDADDVARQLVDESASIRKALMQAFGKDVFDEDQRLRRRLLGRVVFSDKRKLDRLNEIIRTPLLREVESRISQITRKYQHSLVVVDMAILLESGIEKWFDKIVVITAPLEKRIQWIQKSRGWSREEILMRVQSQMMEKELIERADFIIENEGTIDHLREKAKYIYHKLIRK